MNFESNNSDSTEFDRWYQIGVEAVSCESWLYALECLSKATLLDPDHQSARKQKHRASRRVHKQTSGLKKAETVKLAAIKSRLIAAEARSDWGTVDALAEEVLAKNPWDAGMFVAIAKAAERRQAFDIAEYGWVCAIKIDGTQVKWLRALGDLFHQLGRHEDAKGCYLKMQQLDPASRSGEELMHAVDVATMLRDGGPGLRRANGLNANDSTPETEVMNQEEVSRRDEVDVDQQQRREKIRKAEDYVGNDQLGHALELYQEIARQFSHQPSSQTARIDASRQRVLDRIDEIQLALLRKRARTAATAAAANPAAGRLQKSAEEHTSRYLQHEFEVLSRRVARDPSDLTKVFRLADLCRRTSRNSEALEHFAKCVKQDDLHAESLIGMGECCLKSNQAGVGRRHLEAALKIVTPESHPNAVKLAHYWLGRYFEAAKAGPQASWHYQRITAIDESFRDVSERLCVLQQGLGKDAAAAEAE